MSGIKRILITLHHWTCPQTVTVPLVLKKHSPLLYTESDGTLVPRTNTRAKRAPPVVFAISEKNQCSNKKKWTITTEYWDQWNVTLLFLPLLKHDVTSILSLLFQSFFSCRLSLSPSPGCLCVPSSLPLSNWRTDLRYLYRIIMSLSLHWFPLSSCHLSTPQPPPPTTPLLINCHSISASTQTVCTQTHMQLLLLQCSSFSLVLVNRSCPQSIQCAPFQITFVSGGAIWPYL